MKGQQTEVERIKHECECKCEQLNLRIGMWQTNNRHCHWIRTTTIGIYHKDEQMKFWPSDQPSRAFSTRQEPMPYLIFHACFKGDKRRGATRRCAQYAAWYKIAEWLDKIIILRNEHLRRYNVCLYQYVIYNRVACKWIVGFVTGQQGSTDMILAPRRKELRTNDCSTRWGTRDFLVGLEDIYVFNADQLFEAYLTAAKIWPPEWENLNQDKGALRRIERLNNPPRMR